MFSTFAVGALLALIAPPTLSWPAAAKALYGHAAVPQAPPLPDISIRGTRTNDRDEYVATWAVRHDGSDEVLKHPARDTVTRTICALAAQAEGVMAAQKYSDMYILRRNATHDIYMRSRVRSKSPDRVRRYGGVPLGAYAPPLGCIPLPMTASSKPPSIATHSTDHSTMEGLPTELIEYIASFACTDDGSTGRALSAVSRAVRESTAAFRFHALALRGAHQISAFVALLESLSDPVNDPLPATWEKRGAVPVTRPISTVQRRRLSDSFPIGPETKARSLRQGEQVARSPIRDRVVQFTRFPLASLPHRRCRYVDSL
jgi:hypothetical protein